MENEYGSESDSVSLSLNTGNITIDRNNLNDLIMLVKNYLYKSGHEHADIFSDELNIRPIVSTDDNWQIGSWSLVSNSGELELVRIPPRGEIMYYFIARFKKADGKWSVSSFKVNKMIEVK